MNPIIIIAETGSDITPELASEYNITLVPMHVTFDNHTMDDSSFPVQKICDYYKETGKLPRTSGCSPDDFIQAFDTIHTMHPDAQILYLAYSAVTTCSYQSAVIASEGRDYVTMIDTRQVSIGQAAIVTAIAKSLQENPNMTLSDAVTAAKALSDRTRMCFLPDNLEFLKVGGRVSNTVCLGSRILNIHPCIEILDGKLVATKKYRGKMKKIARQLIIDYAENYHLDHDILWFVRTVRLANEVQMVAEETAKECGFRKIQWLQANGVITTHGGPAAFGLAGFTE